MLLCIGYHLLENGIPSSFLHTAEIVNPEFSFTLSGCNTRQCIRTGTTFYLQEFVNSFFSITLIFMVKINTNIFSDISITLFIHFTWLHLLIKDEPQKLINYHYILILHLQVQLMNPSTKLLVVVRDPVTRAISDYTQAISKKKDMKSFEQLVFVNGTVGTIVDTSWGPIKLGIYSR